MTTLAGLGFTLEDTTPGATRNDLLAARVGHDIAWSGDFDVTSRGDLALVRGLGSLRANLMRALVTRPGELFWTPDYGIGAQDFLGLKASAENILALESRIRDSLLSHPLVDGVSVKARFASDFRAIEIDLRVRVGGSEMPIDLRLQEN